MNEHLASFEKCVARIRHHWPAFLVRRKERLAEQERFGRAAEKVAEDIVGDLFTSVLDWSVSDLNHQIDNADLLLTKLGVKYLIVETKRPGALAWHRAAVHLALAQAWRYAAEQKVRSVAVSDGIMLYAADAAHGGLRDRLLVSLESDAPPEELWWLSVHGIYRPRPHTPTPILPPAPPAHGGLPPQDGPPDLLHPKYKLPARCFAYVGDPAHPGTWKLPYLRADGSVDAARLPKAIQAILTNYRGAKVGGIPERAIPDVLVRLAETATRCGKMPHQSSDTPLAYRQLAEALEQCGRLDEITSIPTVLGGRSVGKPDA